MPGRKLHPSYSGRSTHGLALSQLHSFCGHSRNILRRHLDLLRLLDTNVYIRTNMSLAKANHHAASDYSLNFMFLAQLC